MERYAFALAIASTGCHLVFALDPPSDGSVEGSEVIIPDGCYGSRDVVVCPQQELPASASIPATIDTDGDECLVLEPPSTVNICAIGAKTLSITSLRAQGTRPIVIIGDIVTLGSVDVSSRLGDAGAGARMTCSLGAAPATGAGSAGGSHGAIGGGGGTNAASEPGGVPREVAPNRLLAGGCPGQLNNLAAGGPGGGAVAVIAASLMITGPINASGAGGSGGLANGAGGAGGGAGGMIYVESADVSLGVSGQLFANGGGGGEGAEIGTGGGFGLESTSATSPGAGGNVGAGADGGSGGYATVAAVKGGNGASGRGGGGGGGGVGVIRILPDPVGDAGNVSPPATP